MARPAKEFIPYFFRARTKWGKRILIRGIDLGLDMGEEYYVSLFQWEDVSILSRSRREPIDLVGGLDLRINEDQQMLSHYGILVDSLETV